MKLLCLQKLCHRGIPALFALAVSAIAPAQTGLSRTVVTQAVKSSISLQKQSLNEIMSSDLPESSKSLAAKAPANFHIFRTAKVGQSSNVDSLTLNFALASKLTGIHSTPDFKVEQGSSCVEGNTYAANASCTLLVRFTPQGAGQRSGKITIEHSASTSPFYVGLNGYGSGPIVSFTPAAISTVPTSYPSSKGLFSGATSLAVDGGDTVYVADTGNNVIRFLNASGAFQTFNGDFGYTAPIGVVVDDFGTVIETQDSPDHIITNSYNSGTSYGPTNTSCNTGSTCDLFSPGLYFYTPGALAYDHSGNTFANTPSELLRLSQGTDGFLAATPLSSNYDYSRLGNPLSLAVDTNDTTYTYYQFNGNCLISSQSYYSAANSLNQNRKIAGGSSACGFGGDGGLARNALISTYVGQMTLDIAGNFYFSDTGNQRVRRIDAGTGVITTIAGTGTAGYTGDGGAATTATLSSPTGLGIDSQGQVYIVSSTTATGTSQVIRKLGVNGYLNFGNQLKSTLSVAKIVTVANTGNDDLSLASVSINGANASDFTIDTHTTNCNLAVNAVLNAGKSCMIGVIFKPAAAGTRVATLVMLDNTVNGSNTVNLTGSGTLPSATVTITSPATGSTFTAGSSVVFSVTVNSTTSTAPTGTVKFTNSNVAVGNPVTISSGSASVTITNLTAGSHILGATYSGDANYAASGTVNRTITVTAAAKVPATVTLKPKTNPATTCTPIAFSIAVAAKSGTQPTAGATPGGEIRIMEANTLRAKGTVTNGIASLTIPVLSAGTHTLTAVYAGDSSHASADSTPLKEVVAQAATCTQTPTNPIQRVTHPR